MIREICLYDVVYADICILCGTTNAAMHGGGGSVASAPLTPKTDCVRCVFHIKMCISLSLYLGAGLHHLVVISKSPAQASKPSQACCRQTQRPQLSDGGDLQAAVVDACIYVLHASRSCINTFKLCYTVRPALAISQCSSQMPFAYACKEAYNSGAYLQSIRRPIELRVCRSNRHASSIHSRIFRHTFDMLKYSSPMTENMINKCQNMPFLVTVM